MEINLYENEHNLLKQPDLAEEIQRLEEELINEREQHLRTMADFKNYRRRIERDGNKIAEENKREIFLSLLNAIDDMEKALRCGGNEDEPFFNGMKIIYQKLLAMLERYGVLPFESLGMQFDHNLHEAIAVAEHEGVESGTIIDELRHGYMWNNELLRVAQVRVAGW